MSFSEKARHEAWMLTARSDSLSASPQKRGDWFAIHIRAHFVVSEIGTRVSVIISVVSIATPRRGTRATAPNAAGVASTTGSCGRYADSRRLDVPIRQVRDAPLAASAIPEKFPPKPSGR
jgi:hypothetical protein